MSQALANLSAHTRNLRFTHTMRRHHICQTASFHVLHHHPQIALPEVRVFKVYNVWMGRFAHDEDFVDDEILFRLFFEVHLFDSDRQSLTIYRGVYTARRTVFVLASVFSSAYQSDAPLTNLSEILVHQIRVSGCTYHPQLPYHVFILLLLLFPSTGSRPLLLSRRRLVSR